MQVTAGVAGSEVTSVAPKVRSDLRYHHREIDGDEVVFVHDPVRGTYFRFNVLQAAMLQSMDGRTTADAIAAALGQRFEVEVPTESALRFITRARTLYLLDISAYDETPSAASREVRKALRAAGFSLHTLVAAAPVQTERGRLLAAALAELRREHPRAAASLLAKLLELEPECERARALYQLIHDAFIRSTGATTDFPSWKMFDPSGAIDWVNRVAGNVLFSWVGALLMLSFAGLGAYAYMEVEFERIAFGPWEIALAVVFKTFSGLLHELGHGIACQRYGGRVTDIGFTMLYYVQPAFYCDTSSSYLIQNRRHRVVIQLAGSVMSLMIMSGLALTLAVLRPDVGIYPGLALVLLIASALVFVNFNPFLKFDGYYALSDYLGCPNMRDRALKVLRAWSAQQLLGLSLPVEPLSRRTRLWLVTYALAALGFTSWFVYLGLARVLVPVVEHYGAWGLVASIAVVGYLMRNMLLRPMWRLGEFLFRERRSLVRSKRSLVALGLVGAGLVGLAWPCAVTFDVEIALVGEVRAEARAKAAGQVVEVQVASGQRVVRGQPVARLRNPELITRRAVMRERVRASEQRLAALHRGARTESLAVARTRVARARAALAEVQTAEQLSAESVTWAIGTLAEVERASAVTSSKRAELEVATHELALLDAGERPELLAAAAASHAELAAELALLETEVSRLVVPSPIDGVVVTARPEDQLQRWVDAGDSVVEVQDLSRVVGELVLPPRSPLAELPPNAEVAARLYSASSYEIHTHVDRSLVAVQQRAGGEHVVLHTRSFSVPRPVVGATGHARIYGARRSVAYAKLYVPLRRLWEIGLWKL